MPPNPLTADRMCIADYCKGPGHHYIKDGNNAAYGGHVGCNAMPLDAKRPFFYECRVGNSTIWGPVEVGISEAAFRSNGCDPADFCTPVPEPASTITLLCGAIVLAGLNARRKS